MPRLVFIKNRTLIQTFLKAISRKNLHGFRLIGFICIQTKTKQRTPIRRNSCKFFSPPPLIECNFREMPFNIREFSEQQWSLLSHGSSTITSAVLESKFSLFFYKSHNVHNFRKLEIHKTFTIYFNCCTQGTLYKMWSSGPFFSNFSMTYNFRSGKKSTFT